MKIIDTCDLESQRWLTNVGSQGDTPILGNDNSFHTVPVYEKTVPGCDKHQFIQCWRLRVKTRPG